MVSFYHIALSKLRGKTDLFDNLYGERSLILLVNPQRKLFQAEEETDEEKQFRDIYKKIAGEVSTFRMGVFLEESRHDTHAQHFQPHLPSSGHAGLRQRAPNDHEERTQQTWAEMI